MVILENDDEENEQEKLTCQLESSNQPQQHCPLLARLEDYIISSDNNPSDEETIDFTLFVDCESVNLKKH